MRSAGGTCGTGSVSIERMTTCSWRMRLCSTLARIASGVVVLLRLRKTAVPGVRCNGGRRSCSASTNSRSEPSSLSRRAVTSWRPRCQVVSAVNTVTAISSGSQAPWAILVVFAARKSRSTVSSAPAPPTTSQSGFPHWWRTM